MSSVFLLTGRSIDGSVFRSGMDWTDSIAFAKPFATRMGVEGMMAEALNELNRSCIDESVGRLEIREMDRADFEAKQKADFLRMEKEQALWDAENDPANEGWCNCASQCERGL